MGENKVVVITGASDGIGAAAARRLHADGHTVVVVGRSVEKTRAVATELNVDSYVADFTRFDDVERLAGQLRAAYPRIDVLANNARGVFGTRTKTVDGFEKTFQVNHLAPFRRASVLQTSGTVRFAKEIHLDDLDHDRDYDPVHAFASDTTSPVMHARPGCGPDHVARRRHPRNGLAVGRLLQAQDRRAAKHASA